MKHFKKIMIGMDLSSMDETILMNIKHMIAVFDTEKIYFVHVSKDLSIPEDIKKTYPDLLAPADETIRAGIEHEVKVAGMKEIPYEVLVKEGNPMETILRWCKIKDVDLLVMGRKSVDLGSGTLAKNLAQRAPTSILFIPEKANVHEINRILVPVDFSDYSLMTLELAHSIAKGIHAKILCCHLYEIPAGYSKTGKSHSEFAKVMLEHAKKDFKKFIEKAGLGDISCEFILKDDKSEANYIIKLAEKEQVDFIVIGSRGRSNSAAILLGSVSERLIQLNDDIPTLVLKKRGENMGFLEALMKI
ncbi:universal stress protein [Lunatibacter salilacus]|uniref:universal stress protein n=1 Tax=Lunatibacter salilacus TaxID=2483804 RepID=UPI00131C14A3|nr:universal stress protein [Lunatibacter salilacus]